MAEGPTKCKKVYAQVCRDFSNGKCRYKHCRYEHTDEPIFVEEQNTFFLIRTPGTIRRGHRDTGHLPVCETFFKTGQCQNNDFCRYVHLVITPTRVCETAHIGRPTFCRHWLNNNCLFHGECNFLHASIDPSSGVDIDTLMGQQRYGMVCRHWTRGSCTLGAKCKFQHTPLQAIMPPPPPNSIVVVQGQVPPNETTSAVPVAAARELCPHQAPQHTSVAKDPQKYGGKAPASLEQQAWSHPLNLPRYVDPGMTMSAAAPSTAIKEEIPDYGSLRAGNIPQTGPTSSISANAHRYVHWANVCKIFGIIYSEELANKIQDNWMPASLHEIRTLVSSLFEEGMYSEPCISPARDGDAECST